MSRDEFGGTLKRLGAAHKRQQEVNLRAVQMANAEKRKQKTTNQGNDEKTTLKRKRPKISDVKTAKQAKRQFSVRS